MSDIISSFILLFIVKVKIKKKPSKFGKSPQLWNCAFNMDCGSADTVKRSTSQSTLEFVQVDFFLKPLERTHMKSVSRK